MDVDAQQVINQLLGRIGQLELENAILRVQAVDTSDEDGDE